MHFVIIGNGISGITCARNIRKLSDHRITVISSESEHFYSRTALMYIYMGHMRYQDTKPYEDWFWAKNRIDLVFDHVEKADTQAKEVHLKSGGKVAYDKLLIATGSASNLFGWPGQDLPGVQGLYSLQDLALMEKNTAGAKRAVIVGGGLIGIEMAEMLCTRDIPVTFLVREDSFWNNVLPAKESAMINRHIAEHGIDLRLSSELKAIHAGEHGRVASVETKTGEQIECDFVGLTVGVHPNIGFLKGSDIPTDRGVLVNEYLETSVPDVYAAGDCAQFKTALPGRRPVEQVWYTGKMQGTVAAYNMCGKPLPYAPGNWFNSAKFFDIEYQTYGAVNAQAGPSEAAFYWEHPDGKKAVRLVYHRETREFLGMNAMGIRYRHHLVNQFLNEKRSIKYVIADLGAAHFDPEFYAAYEPFLVERYNRQFPGDKIEAPAASKKGWGAFSKIYKGATT